MALAVLVLLWLAVLVPGASRWLSERYSDPVDDFKRQLRVLRRSRVTALSPGRTDDSSKRAGRSGVVLTRRPAHTHANLLSYSSQTNYSLELGPPRVARGGTGRLARKARERMLRRRKMTLVSFFGLFILLMVLSVLTGSTALVVLSLLVGGGGSLYVVALRRVNDPGHPAPSRRIVPATNVRAGAPNLEQEGRAHDEARSMVN